MMASLLLSEMTETKGSLYHFSKPDFDWYTFFLLLTASTISISGFFYAFLSHNWFHFSLFKSLLDCILRLILDSVKLLPDDWYDLILHNDASAFQGATIILSNTPPIARHVVDAAFDRQQHNKQLVRHLMWLLHRMPFNLFWGLNSCWIENMWTYVW